MPHQSITDLKKAIESAPEMTGEHREQMLALVESLAKEVGTVEGERSEHLKTALTVAGDVVRQRSEEGDHDLSERVAELEEKAELLALEHPVVANVLNAISRLI
jgi:hypothetical protein